MYVIHPGSSGGMQISISGYVTSVTRENVMLKELGNNLGKTMFMMYSGPFLIMGSWKWIGFGSFGPFPESGEFQGELYWSRYNFGFFSVRRFG